MTGVPATSAALPPPRIGPAGSSICWGRTCAALALTAALAGPAVAQPTTPDPPASQDPAPPSWEVRASAALYILPDEENYVQPTLAADYGGWHLEARYNYEDRDAVSGFVGWNLEFGSSVAVEFTPMIGLVTGTTDGIVPAATMDLSWKRLEFYLEAEYVVDISDADNSFFYQWSEASVWLTGQIRAGVVTQRTRVYRTPRDIQRGLIMGVAIGRVEGAVYVFNPFDDDHFVVASIGLTF